MSLSWSLSADVSFRGTPDQPDVAFDETAKAIAHNGVSLRGFKSAAETEQCFVRRMFRKEDLQAYMMRLFLEYAVSLTA